MTLDNFLKDASKTFDSIIIQNERRVFEVTGEINSLFYIKERNSGHQNWGIRKNVIDRLKKNRKPWFLLLLSSPPYPNYFLTAESVEYYIKNKWRLNKVGDYKTATTFPSENEFTAAKQIKKNIKQIIPKIKNEIVEEELNYTITLTEGGEKVVISKLTERNPKLRNEAIKIHGLACQACGFNFQKIYGDWGKGFIEVHHIHPLGRSRQAKVQTHPKNDLTVLCANCHRMIHRKKGTTLTLDELKEKIKKIQ